MPGYFIVPYTDEILYSQIARLFEHTLQRHVYAGLRKIFNKGGSIATIDLPNHLSSLFENYFHQIEGSPESIIHKYTLFPFYEKFLRNEKKEKILRSLLLGSGSRIHVTAGINSSKIKRNRYPRYCPDCLNEMQDIHGEPYWKRDHQIPGVLVCTKHNVFIKDFRPPIDQLNQSVFFPASQVDRDNIDAEKNKNSRLLQISRILTEILNGKYLFDINAADYKVAISKNPRYQKGRNINYRVLTEDVKKYYGHDFLCRHFNEYKDPLSWLPSIVRRPLKYFEPIKHVVIHDFIENCEFKPFLFPNPEWDGSWKCINGVCKRYGLASKHRASVFMDHKKGRETALVKCDCGMEYHLTYQIRNGSRVKSITIKNYGDVWKKTVVAMSKAGHSASSIADKVHTSLGSIRKFLKLNGKKPKELEFQVTLVNRREEWTLLLKSFNNNRVTNARAANNKLYKWLYNNDLNWLRVINRLHTSSPKRNELRLNWDEIDDKLIVKISVLIEELGSKNFRGRITRNLISKLINVERNYFQSNKEKLPKVMDKLNEITETKEGFQIRRLSESIKAIREANQVITIPKALRYSNIRVVATDGVKFFLQNEISKIKVA